METPLESFNISILLPLKVFFFYIVFEFYFFTSTFLLSNLKDKIKNLSEKLKKWLKKTVEKIKESYTEFKGETVVDKIINFIKKVILDRKLCLKLILVWLSISYVLAGLIEKYFYIKILFWFFYVLALIQVSLFAATVFYRFTFCKILVNYLNFLLNFIWCKVVWSKKQICHILSYIDNIYFLHPVSRIKYLRKFFFWVWVLLLLGEQIDLLYVYLYEMDKPGNSGFGDLCFIIADETIPALYEKLIDYFYPEPPERGV